MSVPPLDIWIKTGEPLIWFGGAGHEYRREASYTFDAAARREPRNYCLQLTLAGHGYYERAPGAGRELLGPGMAFLDRFPGTFRYGYPPESDQTYELAFVTLVGTLAEQICSSINETFGTVLDFGPDNPVAPLMLALAHQWHEGGLGDRYLLSARLHQLLMTVYSELSRSRQQTTPLMNRALGLLSQHAGDPDFTVARLARQLGCSREHLTRQFRAATGVSASDYLIQHRLRRVARDLQRSGEKLEQIAQRNGFSGANYLCRAFRQHFGVTPAAYRRHPGMAAL